MGKLADYITDLLNRQIKDYGIIVWYDPEGQYTQAIDSIKSDAQLFKFNGSFFELKHELDTFLEDPKRPKLLIYVPKDRNDTNNALIEFEKAGCILEPGHSSLNQNTRLEVLARAVLKPIMPDNVENICKQVASGSLSFEEIEDIAEQSAEIGYGTIKLIFGSADPIEVALQFLAQPELDEQIAAKKAISELVKIIEISYGVMLPNNTTEARAILRRHLLLADFVEPLSQEEIPSALSQMELPTKTIHMQNTVKLAARWRSYDENKDAYIRDAKIVEQECKVESFNIPAQLLRDSQTFRSTENCLIDWACELILNSDFDETAKLIGKRKNSFWSRTEEVLLLKWSILESVVNIGIKVTQIREELKTTQWTPAEFIHRYCNSDSAWYELDKFQRGFEDRYERYDIDLSIQESSMEQVIAKARQLYTDTVGDLAAAFQNSCENNQFECGDIKKQREIFAEDVKSVLGDRKIAYIWVDALRYEMATELVESFGADFEIELQPSASTLPGITAVGMASLLPVQRNLLALRQIRESWY